MRGSSPSPERLLVYAVNESPSHAFMLLTSVRSARRFSNIPILVNVFGGFKEPLVEELQRCGNVKIRQGVEHASLPVTGLKWAGMIDTGADEILFADTDTYFFRSPELLFERVPSAMFAARREVGTNRAPTWCGGTRIAPQLQHRQLKYIFAALGGLTVPVFNTGLMLVRRPLLERMAHVTADVARFCADFAADRIPYPSSNLHIAEEIAATLALSRVSGFTWSELDPELVPFYLEFRANPLRFSVVVHTWSTFYADFLREFISAASAESFRRAARSSPEDLGVILGSVP